MSIIELEKDLGEVNNFLEKATREKVKSILSSAQRNIKEEIRKLEIKQSQQNNSSAKSAEHKRYIAELQEYAWDQSDKFVKIFVTLNGVQNITATDVTTTFTESSLNLIVRNLNEKDYCLTINNLLSPIDIEKSYHKVKTDMIVIYMKKRIEANQWSHLTATEKRLKEMKDSRFKGGDDADDTKDDPTAGIMNLMKNMYQSGDSEMKRMIAKAWTESQEKTKEKIDM